MSDNLELPVGWKEVPLERLASYETGRTPARANQSYWATDGTAGVPWVSIGDMTPYGTVKETKEQISKRALAEVFRGRTSSRGTLLMSFKLTIGRVSTLAVDACHNEAIISIYPKPEINQKYLEYFLSQVDYAEYQDRAVKGNTLNQEKINRISISRPEKPEQEKIAAVLWKVQKAVEVQDKLVRTTRELKAAAMQRLFSHGLRNEPQKETEIGFIPESWDPTPVVKLGTVKGGKRMPKGVSLVRENTGRPYIRVTDFVDHGVRESGILFVPVGYEGVIQRYRISSRDVYISIAGSIGLVGQVPERLDDANLTENAAKIVFERKDVLPRYVMYALAGDACQNQIERATAKNAQPKLALTRIEQILVPFPPEPDEQRDIVAILDTLSRKIALHEKKRDALQDLFQALLHDLMTARIRVDKLDIDTSEVAG